MVYRVTGYRLMAMLPLILWVALATGCRRGTPTIIVDEENPALRESAVAQLKDLHLLEPFWQSSTIYRESVLCVQDSDDSAASGRLLFPATKIIAVHSADGTRQFLEGSDFTLSSDGSRILRSSTSMIPSLKATDFLMPKGTRPAWTGGAQPATPCALPHKVGDPNTHLLFDNGHWFHDQQIEVTYERAKSDWPGVVPQQTSQLPKTMARLREKKKLTVGISGDSISYGYNSSRLTETPPFMPMYPNLVAAQLGERFNAEIVLFNRATSGWGVPKGLRDLPNLLAHEIDLFIIAYGMNDVGRRDPGAYQAGIRSMLSQIKTAKPESEVILVAPMVGNDQWNLTPRDMFPLYRDALEALCTDGVVLVDLTSLWLEMLKRKRDCDLTGNGVNHPSDFGQRIYASAILSLIVDKNNSDVEKSESSNPGGN
jgi:acyl-CoA thioesterase-1